MNKLIIVIRLMICIACIASTIYTASLITVNCRTVGDMITPLIGCISLVWTSIIQLKKIVHPAKCNH